MLKTISTNKAPVAIGPYAQAVVYKGLVFCSGQIPLDPESMALVDGDIKNQTRQCMNNLQALLEAAGSSFGQVIKTTIFLTDLGDFSLVNEVYGSFFSGNHPARSTVQVAALPRSAKIEIECVATIE